VRMTQRLQFRGLIRLVRRSTPKTARSPRFVSRLNQWRSALREAQQGQRGKETVQWPLTSS